MVVAFHLFVGFLVGPQLRRGQLATLFFLQPFQKLKTIIKTKVKMKKILLLLFMVFCYTLVYCQSLNPTVIATAGNFYANANNSVSWTIGECIPETFSDSSNKLTQGFQQGIYEIKTAADFTENLLKINLYPNPATDFVNLEISSQNDKVFTYQLFDVNGKCLKNEKITSVKSEITLTGYSGGILLLNVFENENKLLKSFKIIKIK